MTGAQTKVIKLTRNLLNTLLDDLDLNADERKAINEAITWLYQVAK